MTRFAAIVLLALALRLYGVGAPLVDHSAWRQVDTASIARNFVESEFNPLKPQLDYDGPGPNYVQLELQITPLVIALLYKAFGVHDVIARLVPVAFFLISLGFLYLLVRFHLGEATALWSAAVYAVLPLGVYFGRAVMPESAMLCFGLGALYVFSVWLERPSPFLYVAAVLFVTLALLAKLPNAFLGLPLAALAFARRGWRTVVSADLLAGAVVALGLTYLYFRYEAAIAVGSGDFVSRIAVKHIAAKWFDAWRQPEAAQFLRQYLIPYAVTLAGLVPFLLGVVTPGTGEGWLYAWLAVESLYVATIVAVIRFDYYLVPVLPLVAVFCGKGLARLGEWAARAPATADAVWRAAAGLAGLGVIAGILAQGWTVLAPLYRPHWDDYRQALALKEALAPGAPIVIGTYNPPLLYYSGHKGWRTEHLTIAELDRYRAGGARYLVPLAAVKDAETQRFLDARFARRRAGGTIDYYDLASGD